MRFLAIGECMAEFAPATRVGDYRLGFAGDTFNTAWYLARIAPKVAVSYFTAIGVDLLSQQMRGAMVAGGIDDSHVRTIPDRTVGLYLISLDKGERSFSYWRGQSAARCLADDPNALAQAMSQADTVYFSGITLAILDPAGRQVLLRELRRAGQAGKTVAFDPNLRPRLWSDTAEMTGAIMQGAAVSTMVLPSFEDEASWFGDTYPGATADRYATVGVQTIIVKNGGDPVTFQQGAIRGSVPVPDVSTLVDTTAAGDSFNAGVLAGLAHGLPLPHAIALGCRLAGQVVQAKGALVPIESGEFAL